MADESTLLRCESVRVSRGERDLLPEVSFACAKGGLVVVRGRSGAGKSLLLGVLAGVRRPTSGQVLLDGLAVSRASAAHRDVFRRRVGFLPQRLHLFEDLTVGENVAIPLLPRRPDAGAADRASALLARLDLTRLVDQPVAGLSGGERQRAALARALVTAPSIVLLDEPTAHQDDERCRAILALVADERMRGAAVVLATHDARVPVAADATLVDLDR